MSQNNNPHGVVSRYEFEAAMARIEALLETQTQILVKLAASETDNKHRDKRIDEAHEKASKATAELATIKLVAARAAGAASVVVVIAQMFLKKLGYM